MAIFSPPAVHLLFSMIELRQVSVHNLKGINLDLPLGKMIVLCGRSGSGKSSLAFDTLYAEGQRRYIETFSAYTRQFLAQVERPDAKRIDGVPPAVAVTDRLFHHQNRGTIGTATETTEHLRLLFARIGHVFCPHCGEPVHVDTPQSILQSLKERFDAEERLQIAFAPEYVEDKSEFETHWRERGFVRGMIGGEHFRLDGEGIVDELWSAAGSRQGTLLLVVDRLTLGIGAEERIVESLETALQYGNGKCFIIAPPTKNEPSGFLSEATKATQPRVPRRNHRFSFYADGTVSDQTISFSSKLACNHCNFIFPPLEPKLFRELRCQNDEDRSEYLSESLAVKIDGKNIAELTECKVTDLKSWFHNLRLTGYEHKIAHVPLEQIRLRLEFLEQVGLGYLTLSRPMQTLSGGERRRIGLASALGSSLVDMLYVLDEPSAGLHPADMVSLLETIKTLQGRGNTVVVVEHEEAFLRMADQIVEIGPGAGESGGQVVFQGTAAEMLVDTNSETGKYLSGERGLSRTKRRRTTGGEIKLSGCCGHHLKNLTVSFPLGMLCVVTGVSGAGKSSLVCETLYPALLRHLHSEKGQDRNALALPYESILVGKQIEDVVLVDHAPIGRSSRSNPVTYLKIFDEIRNVFAATVDAKARNFTPGKFSFNVEGGRCEHCKGDGFTVIDMQFMADMTVRCPDCNGKRYRPEILEILYRGRNIAEVLDMTAREAFAFFRGQNKVQQKLKRLLDVGLDYIRLGQPANTLSGGELQRLKLATYLSLLKKERTLFIMDEPTTGLHFADIVQLLDCFDSLIATGHSLIVVEHNLQLIREADYIIDLGPGAAEHGGNIVAQGTPEEVAAVTASKTGELLRGR